MIEERQYSLICIRLPTYIVRAAAGHHIFAAISTRRYFRDDTMLLR